MHRFEIFQGNMGNGNQSQTGPDHFNWMYTMSVLDERGGCELVTSTRTRDRRTCPPETPLNTWDAAVTRRKTKT